ILVLDELRTDVFREFVGDARHLSIRRSPQAIAVALALRHSWRPDDLAQLAKQLAIGAVCENCSAGPSIGPSTPINRGRKPGHHRRDSRARLRPVKALRFASTPCGASGLDRDVGRAR